jgi:hypothetical protein
MLGSNLDRDTSHLVLFPNVTQPFQAKAGVLSLLEHDRSLPNPFWFRVHQISYHSTVYNPATDSVVNALPSPSKEKNWVRDLG